MAVLWRARFHAPDLYPQELGDLRMVWRRACEGVGLCHVVHTASGPTICTPRVAGFTGGSSRTLLVQLLPGQLPEDVEAVAYRLAPSLGVAQLRVTHRQDLDQGAGGVWVRVALLTADPLADTLPCVPHTPDVSSGVPGPGPMCTHDLWLGRDEHGRDVTVPSWRDMPHVVMQGATRSGKSWAAYSLLAQAARDPELVVTGCDPTGLLLRPFTGTRHAPWQVRGLREVTAHVAVLERLVAEMDARIEKIPDDRDTSVLSAEQPLALVVLEEYPALLRATDTSDAKLGRHLRGLVARLAAEGHKVGFRLLIIVQRAEAGIVDGVVRAQCEGRLSFRVDNLDSVRLLHPDAGADLVARHTTSPSGIALLALPGQPLARVRCPALGGYREYTDSVRTACRVPDSAA